MKVRNLDFPTNHLNFKKLLKTFKKFCMLTFHIKKRTGSVPKYTKAWYTKQIVNKCLQKSLIFIKYGRS